MPRGFRKYLLRSLVTGVFGGSPDNLIDKLVRNIQENQDFILTEVFGVIRADNRSLDISPDVIFNQYYGSRTIHLFFNLWYQAFDYTRHWMRMDRRWTTFFRKVCSRR